MLTALKKNKAQASFFLTGRFYRNPSFKKLISRIKSGGYYLGPHSDQHLLYCDWTNRDSLLVTKQQFVEDLNANVKEIEKTGIKKKDVKFFIPPYEWYNDSIAHWTEELNMQLINYSPGTKSTADYTWPDLKNYRSSEEIYKSIIEKEKSDVNGLNGFILLLHIGTDPRRTDKFYNKLDDLLKELKKKGYKFTTIADILK
ncbi:MAG TPA: polysaccharide deacetylase family protein [Segetibacter sp.]